MLGGLHALRGDVDGARSAPCVQGEGDLIDISMQECAASMLEYCAAAWEYESLLVERSGNTPRAEWGVYQTLDGWAGVCCPRAPDPGAARPLGLPHEERFTRPGDPAHRATDELMAHVLVFMMERTKDELVALGPPNKLPIGAVRTPAELVDARAADRAGLLRRRTDGGRLPGRPFPGFGWASLAPVATASVDDVLASWADVAAAGVAS